MKIARYTSMSESGFSYESIHTEEDGNGLESACGYVRLTEFIDVNFVPLQSGEVVEKQVAALDVAETELRNKFQAALNKIEQRREELRAITYQG